MEATRTPGGREEEPLQELFGSTEAVMRMFPLWVGGLVLGWAATMSAAQTGSAPISLTPAPWSPASPWVAAGGCGLGGARATEFPLGAITDNRDKDAGSDLANVGVHAFRVLGVTIVGGFVPSTNVAAQAGALNPTQAAVMAAGEAGGPGRDEHSDRHVDPVRAPAGACQ